MAGNKYLSNAAGKIQEVAATQTSAGAANAGQIPALTAAGLLDMSLMPVGIGAETDLIVASESVAAGAFVNIWMNGAVANVRNADASTSGKEANGFVLAAFASAAKATVYRVSQLNNQLTGMTPGVVQYLNPATPGGVTATCPSATGQTVQILGHALSATAMAFSPGPVITLA